MFSNFSLATFAKHQLFDFPGSDMGICQCFLVNAVSGLIVTTHVRVLLKLDNVTYQSHPAPTVTPVVDVFTGQRFEMTCCCLSTHWV